MINSQDCCSVLSTARVGKCIAQQNAFLQRGQWARCCEQSFRRNNGKGGCGGGYIRRRIYPMEKYPGTAASPGKGKAADTVQSASCSGKVETHLRSAPLRYGGARCQGIAQFSLHSLALIHEINEAGKGRVSEIRLIGHWVRSLTRRRRHHVNCRTHVSTDVFADKQICDTR